ncbi:MAG TPA: formylglycine-generating enzyme family protein, partial [Myxococcota bacterium]|nr:formylglycine-generating enzyme family protein [Myxococcota bacterium]
KEFRGDDVPVVCVDWDQAAAYANWVGGRLPTEAEWEYAASSGGQIKEYPWGAKAATCEKAVMRDELFQKKSKSPKPDGCGLNRPWPVCSKLSGNTVQGLCDMAGNVWEWVSDWYWISGPAGIFEWPYGYSSKAQTNPTGPSSGTYRVIRGGAWNNDSFNLRINKRESVHPGRKSNAVGIRVVR